MLIAHTKGVAQVARIVKEPAERRQEILDTALRLFYENGYEQTSIADIAEALHIAQGLCYRYFPSKEALFDAAIDQYAERQAGRLQQGLHAPAKPLRQLIAEMPTFLDTETPDDPAYRFCHGPESGKVHERLSLLICHKIMPVVEKRLQQAVADGELQPCDPEALASFCVYGQLGLLLDTRLPAIERVQRLRAFLQQLLQQLA